ncbi:MAG: pitrilysin family protein [Kofleriaceae bacterium]
MRSFTLAGGTASYLVEQHALPIVSLDLNFDGGSLLDPPGQEGLAGICLAMHLEGTLQLDKLQYAERLAETASNIGSYAVDDSVGLTLSSLRKHLPTTFELFVETLLSPGLRGSDFDRMIKRRIEAVRQAKQSPSTVASRLQGTVLYGRDHPFGRIVTEASLLATTLQDCRHHAAAWFKPGSARLFVVGDLVEDELRACFDQEALASWQGTFAPPMPPEPSPPAGTIFFVDIPGSSQSQVSMLHFGPRRDAPDYVATVLMAQVLGGGFTSRLNMNLREAKGYSYGARGGFGYTRHHGTFGASASVRADATFEALQEIEREVRELASGHRPVTQDELDREKQGAVLALPSHFATAQGALGLYRRLVYFGLPLSYYDSYVTRIDAIELAAVHAAAAAHLQPDRAVWLVVGDGDVTLLDGRTLRAALVEHVGRGALVELDADGLPND